MGASASRGKTAREPIADLSRYVLGGWLGLALRLALLFALDTLEDLFPMDGNVLRCIDTNSHLIALHPKDGDGDVVTDHHGFTHPSRQYEHYSSSLILGRPDWMTTRIRYRNLRIRVDETHKGKPESARLAPGAPHGNLPCHPLPGPHSTQLAAHQLLHAGQRGIERRRVVTPRLREVRTPAAATANLCGNRTN